MRKLFTFGDSFTFNKMHEECEYSLKYKKDGDMYWPNILSNELNLELHNFGYGSLSNDRILDSIYENIHLINANDVVIIGKSFHNRFDIPNDEYNTKSDMIYKFTTITPNSIELLNRLGFSKEESIHIDFYAQLYSHDNFIKRHNLRFEFIKKFLKNIGVTNCFFWEVEDNWQKYENIKTNTNGDINDLHWSYKGHRDFANMLISTFNLKSI